MKYLISGILFPFFVLLLGGTAGMQEKWEKEIRENENPVLDRIEQTFRGDLDRLRELGVIRVLVSYSKTGFFINEGKMHGFEHDLLTEYENYLNRISNKKGRKIKVIFIPTPFDLLIPALAEGKGDIAAAGLTVTEERKKSVNFTSPYISDVHEVAVLHKDVKDISSIENLSRRDVHVRKNSSYVSHLKELNTKLQKKGLAPVKIQSGNEALVTEDILEMVNAGVMKMTVTDQHIAEAWAGVLPNIRVRRDLVVNQGGDIAWAVRKDAPLLLKNLNTFIRENKKGSRLGNILFKRYYRNSKWIYNPVEEQERGRLEKLRGLFEKYAEKYGFDWLALAALAYQESHLNHHRKSHRGAVGIMQIRPQTAADKNVNIKNINKLENNIHAGVKYLAYLRDNYFTDPDISPSARVDFAWAAYNAGPNKIKKLRTIAEKRGYDPNRWFFNTEHIAAEIIGAETVNYVANINKYYVAYKLYFDSLAKRKEVRSNEEKKINSS
ncbi:MAG: transporter substrate-binding domain-containing protein [Desulfococcaceae bacterium]|jgi:membrane-bound lytic murein transglycosylase MltF|nr:transporter substrate-binding domain-containing protein [Desulfococcaceae bacterium]